MASLKIQIPHFIVNGQLQDREYLLRPLAVELIPQMTERIHQNGLDASNQRIGTYSPGYMKVRTGVFGNAGRFSKGANKGKIKNSGVFTKGKRKGAPRPRYNRSNDTKVIVALTSQLENDWAVIPTDKGYGIGFNNPDNFLKAGYVEATYNKAIFALTDQEIQFVEDRISQLISNAFNS